MSKFPRKKVNGAKNPKYIDVLDPDPEMANQKFVCMSFISPEKILKQREQFLFEKFVEQWDFSRSIQKFSDFLNFVSHKYKLKIDDVLGDLKEFVDEEKQMLKSYNVTDDFKTFLDNMEDKLNDEFNTEHEFQTSVRGVKIRGSFSSQKEAELRAKKLRESDPNHDILVGQVGVWMPWDPDAYKTGRVEFMEEELNQLYTEKIKNEQKAKENFEQRVKDAKRKAIEENVRKARQSGNKLTQTITEDGTLIGVKETVDFESREVAETPKSAIGHMKTEETNEPTNNDDNDELNRVD